MTGRSLLLLFAAIAPLGACVTAPRPVAASSAVEVQILAINDFHGNLEPPKTAIDAAAPDGNPVLVPAGGVASLATAAKMLRAGKPHTVTVSAGDMIGASPLISALFLDEPTIAAMEEVGVNYHAVGNHEFDRGADELLRVARGGCAKHTSRQPCSVEPFDGANFTFLAANVLTANGSPLFPATGITDFGPLQVGFIGMTLKDTATLVSPSAVAGLTFTDEVAAANAAVPALKAAGVDAIVVVLHQGGGTTGGYNDKSCPGLSGEIVPIIDRLDPAIDVLVSGHTHNAYVCEVDGAGRARPLLLTSAGRYGTLVSDIRLTFGPDGTLRTAAANNVIVQGEGYSTTAADVPVVAGFPVFLPDPATKAIVDRYAAAAAPQAARIVGRLNGAVTRAPKDREQSAGNLIADAQLAAGRAHGAQIAFMNAGGVRTDLVPAADGSVTFGQVFAMQPFGNSLVVKTLIGAQLRALLEQQFASGANSVELPNLLLPSSGFFFAYDLSRPTGDKIVEMRLDGATIQPAREYRVIVNTFIASGGDNFTVLQGGSYAVGAGQDLDALEAWLKTGPEAPKLGRMENRTP
ncbi:MAG: bifunctional metallophosphatase/5'-nucleotidase [Sphingomonas sp.]|nr:bifunctional metallophosphatase/5'-nucleotidase [Sphingomonas sp.]